MIRTLDIPHGNMGGAVKLANDPGRARNIHISVINSTAVTHAAFFGRSRRELEIPSPTGIGQPGFPVIAVPNTVANQTVNNVSYGDYVIQGWVGELWAVADTGGILMVDIMDGAEVEK